MQVTPQDLAFVADFVYKLTGVMLDDSKAYLVESRLAELARGANCANYRELCHKARTSGDPNLQERIIDSITTHETLFFRDGSPYEALRQIVVPALINAKVKTALPRRIRIWSAGCSTGQEPYSIAMTLWDLIPNILAWDINILGTDVADAAVRQASLGSYSSQEIQRGIDPSLLKKYFHTEGNGWRVKDELRSLLTFRRQNLLDSFAGLGPYDVIFCRNVAIYFDAKSRSNLFLRLADRLTDDGYLFVGSAESLSDLGARFMPQCHQHYIFYQPNKRKNQALTAGCP
jgi:chemotaxis protein methyltransferase CheR